MRPLTLILLIIVVGVFAFFGFTIYQSKNIKQPSSSSESNVSTEKLNFILKVNSKTIFVNGNEKLIDSPVREIMGRTMVPINFILEFLKAENIKYDEKTEEITFDLEVKKNHKITLQEPSDQIEPANLTEEKGNFLTEEKKMKINSTASMSASYFKIQSIESDGFTVIVKIDLLMEPKSMDEVKKLTDLFTNDVSFIFDETHDIKVIAIRTLSENKNYGYSKFSAETGRIEFTEQVGS